MESLSLLKSFLALIFVLSLIGLTTALLKRFGPEKFQFRIKKAKDADKRLSISEMLTIDSRRRLLLVKRDDVEHLVMLGGEKDLLIEAGITKKPVKAKKS